MKLRAFVVDDEPPARRKIRQLLKNESRIEIAGEAGSGETAVREIASVKPDLVFLDIQMPGMNGFEVLEALGPDRPQVIFTTAYDQFAIQAFEVRALDYLLKPFDQRRFQEAVERAFESVRKAGPADPRIDELLAEIRRKQPFLRRILLRARERILFVDTHRIQWIESEEKYVRIHVEGKAWLHRETMNHLERRLDPALFIRVHRGYLVNMEHIRELQAHSHGNYLIALSDGSLVPLGRSYRERFLERFTGPPS